MKNPQQLLSEAGLQRIGFAPGEFHEYVKPGSGRYVMLQKLEANFDIWRRCSSVSPGAHNDTDESKVKAAVEYLEHRSETALTYAELSTILAALRNFQFDGYEHMDEPWDTIAAMAHFKDVGPLTNDQIDSLCERLNCGEIVPITGGPKR